MFLSNRPPGLALRRRNLDTTKTLYKQIENQHKCPFRAPPRQQQFLIFHWCSKLFRATHFPLTSTSRARPQKTKSRPHTKKLQTQVENKYKCPLGGSPKAGINKFPMFFFVFSHDAFSSNIDLPSSPSEYEISASQKHGKNK